MPQINRIRVNNINYNDGTQRYDDFMMDFGCNNALYDLVNGGGKSILLMLILQTVLPNQELDKKQPLSKLFKNTNNNNTIHSMVEWKLDEEAKRRFCANYLLTGFCAKKGAEGKGDVEYFNYMITYAGYNDNDIANFDLVDGKERVNFANMRKKLRMLQDNGVMNCRVELFETNESYKRKLTEFGIYESHWNIVRGINESEGHVRAYIEKNYKSARQLIDKLLISEIIERANEVRVDVNNTEDDLADSLVDIQDKMLELSKKKKDKDRYLRQVELLEAFVNKLSEYEGQMKLKSEFIDNYRQIYSELLKNKNLLEHTNADISKDIESKHGEETYHNRAAALLSIALIQNTLRGERMKLDGLKEEELRAGKECAERHKNLQLTEAKDYYTGYKDANSRYMAIQKEIELKQESSRDILDNIKNLAAVKKSFDDEYRKKIHHQQAEYNRQSDDINQNMSILVVEEESAKNHKSKNELLIEQTTSTCEKLKTKIESEGVAIASVAQIYNDNNILIKDEDRRASYENKRKLANENIIRNETVIEENEYKLTANDKEKSVLEAKLLYVREELASIDNRIEVYNNKKSYVDNIRKILKIEENADSKSTLNFIHVEVNEFRKKEFTLSQECEKIGKRIKALRDGKSFVENDDLISVFEYLSGYQSSVELGMDYLKNFDDSVKTELLKKIPILPYAVVVDESIYSKLGKSIKFDSLYLENAVPIVCTKVARSEYQMDVSYITYAHADISSFINTAFLEVEADKLTLDYDKKQKEITNLKESIILYSKYESVMHEYIEDFEGTCEELLVRQNSKKDELDKAESRINELSGLIENIISDNLKLKQENKSLVINIDNYDKIIIAFKDRIADSHELEINSNSLKKFVKDNNLLNAKINEFSVAKQRFTTELEAIAANYRELEKKNDNMQRIWEERYNNYYDKNWMIAGAYDFEDSETLGRITSELDGAISAYERDNDDVKDKIENCRVCREQMNDKEKEIKRRNLTLEYLMEYEREHGELVYTPQQLTNDQSAYDEAVNKEKDVAKKLHACDKQCVESETLLKQKLKDYNERFFTTISEDEDISALGVVDSDELNNIEPAIREHKNARAVIICHIKSLTQKQNATIAELNEYKNMINKQGAYAQAVAIELEDTDERAQSLTQSDYYAKEIDTLRKNLENTAVRLNKFKGKCKDNKSKCVAEIKILNPEYAFQIERVEIPDTDEELAGQIEDYTSSIAFFKEEIESIDKTLEEILEIKNKFNMKCIQKALHIKNDIDKFSKYSRMIIDNEEVQAVKLKIHYHPDEIQISKMERYIERIVLDTSGFVKEDEKKKVLRDKLSGKSLFGVIVNDAAGMELSLYKRERIKENSRHLRFEDAVGSTGQSQGIYILLIIAIINYIAKMYSNDTDDKNITKTLFIDNPFGAAKDVYIWDPILSMLRDNNVQLIIPTRGVMPAMTSKFDVYYTLGQKMSGNKMQTVVVNFNSKVEQKEVEYVKLEAEQIDMFSMMGTSEGSDEERD